MNGFRWAKSNDRKILRFGLLALAKGARASHFLILVTPAKIRGEAGNPAWGEFGTLMLDRRSGGISNSGPWDF